MQITAITTEQFVEIYEQLTDVAEQSPNQATRAYSGSLSGIGSVVITSDPLHCMLIEQKVA